MILDSIDNAKKYYSLNSYFKQVFEYLLTIKDREIESGRYNIDSDNAFLLVSEGDGKDEKEAKLEVHRKYIDIQMPLAGNEKIGWKPLTECLEAEGEFNIGKDIMFFKDKSHQNIELKPGYFAIFFPEDAHAPMIGKGKIKKGVVKVIVEG